MAVRRRQGAGFWLGLWHGLIAPITFAFAEMGALITIKAFAAAVLGKGVSGFKVGPMPDYTHYSQIRKA